MDCWVKEYCGRQITRHVKQKTKSRMSSLHLFVKYRPLRIGILVRDQSLPDLVEAARVNAILAGGIYNPIIPVGGSKKDFTVQLIKLFSVDNILPISLSADIKAISEQYQFLNEYHYYSKDLFISDAKSRKKCKYFDIQNIIQYYWSQEFRHKSDDHQSQFAIWDWAPDDPLSDLFHVSIGKFTNKHHLCRNFEKNYLSGLKAQKLKIEKGKPVPVELSTRICPLRFTARRLRIANRPYHDYGVFVGSKDQFDDLLTFWNLRASGIRLEFLPVESPNRVRNYISHYLNQLDKIPNESPNIDDWITVYYNSQKDEDLKELLKQFKTKKGYGFHPCSMFSWNGLNIKPASVFYESKNILGEVEKPYGNYRVVFQLPENSLIKNETQYYPPQLLAVTVSPHTEYEYPHHTLKPPRIFELGEFYSRKLHFKPFETRVESEGVGVTVSTFDTTVNLNPISYQKLVERIFETVGIKSKLSVPGLLTKKIVDRVGDLDGGRVFKITGVRHLLQNLKANDCVRRRQATQTILNKGQFKKFDKLYIEPRETPTLTPDSVFNFLLKNDFFRAGLELICDDCRLKNWLSLKTVDDDWHCSYCGFKNRTSLHLKHRGDWKFRKSGLFAKDNDQEGAIPVIVTLIQFLRVLDVGSFVYTPSLSLRLDRLDCEIDFCVLSYLRDERIEIGIAECKSIGGEIDDKDIDNLMRVREKIKVLDVDCYIILSKTADTFSSDELRRFKSLFKKDIPFILMDNKVLEPYDPYWEIEDIPHQYAHSMEEMYHNSLKIYLS